MTKSTVPGFAFIQVAIVAGIIIAVVITIVVVAGISRRGSESGQREAEPAVSTLAECQAKCRDQYGGSGSAGFDACMRACGAGSAERLIPGQSDTVSTGTPPPAATADESNSSPELRTAACPSPGPACPSPEWPVCHDGRWYCREYPPEGRTSDLNYPSEDQLHEAACAEPAMACEVPAKPECKNGKWICVTPAKGVQ